MLLNNLFDTNVSDNLIMFVFSLVIILTIGWYVFLQEKRHQQLKQWIFKGIQLDVESLKIIELAEDYWKIRYKFEHDRAQFKVRDFERMDRKFKNLFQIEMIDYTNRNYNVGLNLKVLVTKEIDDFPYSPRIGKTIRPEIRFNGAVISRSEVEVYERKLVDTSQVLTTTKFPVPEENSPLPAPLQEKEVIHSTSPAPSAELPLTSTTPVVQIKPSPVVESPDNSAQSNTIKKE
jgi:hypothetical protein